MLHSIIIIYHKTTSRGDSMARNAIRKTADRNAASEALRLSDLIGYHLRRASVFDLNGAVAALEPTGLRTVPMSVLLAIVEEPGITAADICRALGIQRANIVSILTDLDKRGLFLREADPSDSRVQRLHPTPRGREEAARALALIAAHEEKLLSRLSLAERADLRRLLSRIWQDDDG
ncbi:MarR family transcriptional regulator [Sinirhodobacter populi]|uniref:MarR family transcriptional regulator n=2 Tax=Paenirhodobacter populi TaxID=2306993 RepID=A0A443K8S0_9RHOB|nr:MarR family transcriptional regulator [Sinirhodobacter populi]